MNIWKHIASIRLIFLSFFLLAAGSGSVLWAQCPNDNTYYGVDLTPSTCPGTAFYDCAFMGEYVTVNVISGNTYVFSTCDEFLFDTEITVYNNASGAFISYNDDNCGIQSSVTWTATFTGTVRVLVDWFPCDELDVCIPLEVSCLSGNPGSGGGNICSDALPFCTGTTYSFQNNTNVPDLGTIGCLLTSPNPVWYYMEIDQAGSLDIGIQQSDNFGFPIDVDFLLWGPFSEVSTACASVNANPNNNIVDCSFSDSAFEQANVINAQSGEVYVLLLTNFSNVPGTINFTSLSSSTASTNCDILCDIISLSATPSACNATTNTYELSGTIAINNPPASGNLTITSSCGGTATYSAPFPATFDYSIPGINASGGSCTVTATFSADPTCTRTATFTAPASCASVSLNCPQYASVSPSPASACSNQSYFLEVENTGCNGTISFNVVGNWGSAWADEISWNVVSNLTGGVVASGLGNLGLNGQNINVSVGPLNPAVVGNIFTLNVFDSYLPIGDGFNGVGGFITVQQPLGNNLIAPIVGNFGSAANSIFGVNTAISPATITITTPAGPVVQTVEFCRDFRVPLSIDNPNFCNTLSVNLPWTITCNATGAVISSGSNNVIIFPSIPASSNDVVSISFDDASCDWVVSPNNDCDAGDIGSIFTISPNPSGLSYPACLGGQENFTVSYLGISGGPNCCSTGGTPVPTVQNQTFTNSNITVANSPFGGINNAALLSIPANLIGGNATSFDLQINVSNYCFNPPGLSATDFWVTVIVDGNIISDINIPAGINNYNISFDLNDISGGFTSSSVIQIYTYPNAFNAAGVNSTYNPLANCASLLDGVWRADFSASLNVNYSEFQPTPANCNLATSNNYDCCVANVIDDYQETVCSGDPLTYNVWKAQVEAANSTCVVYSSFIPQAGVTLPDNYLPNGINTTTADITQTIYAYTYCDVNGNSVIDAGDTYSLVSTYQAIISFRGNAGTNASINICGSGPSINLFSQLGGTPQTGGTWTGPSALTNDDLGSFTPGISLPGVYTYSVAGRSPCPDASAQVTVTVSSGADASIVYPGAPYCTDINANQSPLINGTAGGTFSSSPAGLSINSSTGAILPSASAAGTYTITYSIPASGTCPAFSTQTTVVITNIPANPILSPNPVCEGSPVTVTAGGGSWYEYFINGVSQALPSADNTFDWSSPSAGDEVCVRSYPTLPIVFNGNINEPAWAAPLATSAGGATSGFGPNYLDALYLNNTGGYLYGAIAGQTANNSNNRILMFIDCIPGGFNNLGAWSNRSNSPYVSVENLNGLITFDPGFNPDFILCMNQATGIAFFDLYDMQSNVNYYLGSNIAADGVLPANLLGYQPNGAQGNITQGFEFAIPLSYLGNPASLQTFCMLVNDPGLGNPAATFVSNQFLSPAGAGEGNYGNGFIDFGAAAPNPLSYALSADCFGETCITVSPSVSPVTGFSYVPEVCEDDLNQSPTTLPGFTAGGSFTAPAGLIINSSSGEVNVAASTPGTYTVTYSVPSLGCNPAASGSFDITIHPTPSTTPIYHE